MTTRRPRVRAVRAVRAVRYASPRRSRIVVALLAATLGSLPLLGPGGSGLGAQPAHAQGTAASLALTLTVNRITPTAPQPGDQLAVGGILTNPTDLQYDDLSIVLRLNDTPLESRSALLAVASASEHLLSDDAGPPINSISLAPHASVPYLLEVPVDALPLTTAGVYRISVEAYRGEIDNREYDARVNTFLPWLPPSAGVPPVRIAWVWPLLTKPRLEADDTFSDDELGVEIAPMGRLGRLLDVASQAAAQTGVVPEQSAPPVGDSVSVDPPSTPVVIRPVKVTPVVDPETLRELQLMTAPYTVKGVAGSHTAEATAYEAQLRALMSVTTSIATPYGDPDIEALAKAKASSLVTQARSTGLEAGWPNIAAGLLWPPDGTLSESTLDTLTTSGLILSNQAVPLTNAGALGYTPSATITVQRPGGTVPAVVVDDGLSKLVTTPVRAQDRTLLAQRYAAETAAIALEAGPTAQRTLVLAPGRRWSPTASSVRALLTETGRLPWLTPSTLPEVLAASPDPAVSRDPLRSPANPDALSAATAARIAGADAELAGFRSILCPAPAKSTTGTPTPTATGGTPATRCNADDQVLPLQRALYRSASTAFRNQGSAGDALLASTTAALRALEGKVRIVNHGDEELVGNRAKLPISIVNGLTVAVKVQVKLIPRSARLSAGAAVALVIAAGGNAQLNLPLSRRAAGSATLLVDAQLLTPSNQRLGAPVVLRVHVSAYGVVVVTITIAVCGLLGLAVIVRIYRRIRNARRKTKQAPAQPAQANQADEVPEANAVDTGDAGDASATMPEPEG